jgi:hypothetical protein
MDAAKTKEKMLEKFQDFHPDIVDALRLVKSLYLARNPDLIQS